MGAPAPGEAVADADHLGGPMIVSATESGVIVRLRRLPHRPSRPPPVRCARRPPRPSEPGACHAVFTNSPAPILAAESAHRGHAIAEQVIPDLKNGAPAVGELLGQQHRLLPLIGAAGDAAPGPLTRPGPAPS